MTGFSARLLIILLTACSVFASTGESEDLDLFSSDFSRKYLKERLGETLATPGRAQLIVPHNAPAGRRLLSPDTDDSIQWAIDDETASEDSDDADETEGDNGADAKETEQSSKQKTVRRRKSREPPVKRRRQRQKQNRASAETQNQSQTDDQLEVAAGSASASAALRVRPPVVWIESSSKESATPSAGAGGEVAPSVAASTAAGAVMGGTGTSTPQPTEVSSSVSGSTSVARAESDGSSTVEEASELTESQILEMVKQQVEEEASVEKSELASVQHQLVNLDAIIQTKLNEVAGSAENRTSSNASETSSVVDQVKNSVKALAETMNSTIETTLHSLHERNEVIKQLIEREESVARVRMKEEQGEDSHVDYESGLMRGENGSLVHSISEIIHAAVHPHAGENDPAVLQEDFVFLRDVVTLLVAATLGGLLAVYMRSPVFVGFILGGMMVGPSGLSLLRKLKYVETLSQIGGPLLLFVQGLQLKGTAIAPLSRQFLTGLFAQLMANTLAIMVVLLWFEYVTSPGEALLLGLCTSVSSSAVSIKIAEDNDHSRTVYFKVLISMAMIQDFVMALLLCLPAAIQNGYYGVFVVFKQMVYVMVLVSASVIAAVRIMPRIIKFFVHKHNPELFLLSLVSMCLAAASFTRWIGLSTEFGAFFAGLVLTRTSLVKEALVRIDPIKDMFCALFFASIGLVISSTFLWKNIRTIIALFGAVFCFKVVTLYVLLKTSGHSRVASFLTSLCMGEIGEFSIFVAGNGYTLGVMSRKSYLLFLAVTVFSLVITPVLFKLLVWVTGLKPTPTRSIISLNELGSNGSMEFTNRHEPHKKAQV